MVSGNLRTAVSEFERDLRDQRVVVPVNLIRLLADGLFEFVQGELALFEDRAQILVLKGER